MLKFFRSRFSLTERSGFTTIAAVLLARDVSVNSLGPDDASKRAYEVKVSITAATTKLRPLSHSTAWQVLAVPCY